jgi:hypothetical protein
MTHFLKNKKYKKIIQTDYRSDTIMCRSANIWHMPHNMHLIIIVIYIYAGEHIMIQSLTQRKNISKNKHVVYTKESYICLFV